MNYYWFIKNGLYRATNTLVIIIGIEVFENDCYKTKPFNIINNEIQLLEQQLNVLKLTETIDNFKYKIEREIFSNKSILFMKDYKRLKMMKSKRSY
jgi:hypothetical protein